MTDFVTDCVYFAGRLKRYHTWPTIQTQTVGEHSWQVALVYEQIFGELSRPVERYIRMHDVAELAVGDIPFPFKSKNPEIKKLMDAAEDVALEMMKVPALPDLDPIPKARIKVCDLLEMTIFGMTERELGNMLAIPIIRRTRAAALQLTQEKLHDVEDFESVCRFIDQIDYRHRRVLEQEKGKIGD